jgi:two-component system phosphate regulon sensor histidine kinase PhoR
VHPSISVDADSRALLLGEELQVHSAFANLVDNAAKYTPPDGSVHIRWWTDQDGGHFAVSDTGIGIPREHLPRLTERFYRVDAGRSRSTGGSGLGLAIVKHVLQRHGGWLAIESVEGRGSRFICHFPPERLAWAMEAEAPTNPQEKPDRLAAGSATPGAASSAAAVPSVASSAAHTKQWETTH